MKLYINLATQKTVAVTGVGYTVTDNDMEEYGFILIGNCGGNFKDLSPNIDKIEDRIDAKNFKNKNQLTDRAELDRLQYRFKAIEEKLKEK
jgi:hypothetical protein